MLSASPLVLILLLNWQQFFFEFLLKIKAFLVMFKAIRLSGRILEFCLYPIQAFIKLHAWLLDLHKMGLDMHKNSCTVLIPLCKNNLIMPMCSSFFLPWTWLPPLLVHHVATSRFCTDCFCCFYRNQFCSPAINQISLSQSKGWFPFILLSRPEI